MQAVSPLRRPERFSPTAHIICHAAARPTLPKVRNVD